MVLNFSNMSDEEDIKATIIHQFGHALGLGHSLMEPSEWKYLKPCVNVEDVENFEVEWTGKKLKKSIVNYDKESVMRYRYAIKCNDIETTISCMHDCLSNFSFQ